jgi:hypothetical protein
MKALSPIVSEFETVEKAEAHDRWLRAKVNESLSDERPVIGHDEAMASARAIINVRRRARARLAR